MFRNFINFSSQEFFTKIKTSKFLKYIKYSSKSTIAGLIILLTGFLVLQNNLNLLFNTDEFILSSLIANEQRESDIKLLNANAAENDNISFETPGSCYDPIGWKELTDQRDKTSKTYIRFRSQGELDEIYLNAIENIEKNNELSDEQKISLKTTIPELKFDRNNSFENLPYNQENQVYYQSVKCFVVDDIHYKDIYDQGKFKEIDSQIVKLDEITSNKVSIDDDSLIDSVEKNNIKIKKDKVLNKVITRDNNIVLDSDVNDTVDKIAETAQEKTDEIVAEISENFNKTNLKNDIRDIDNSVNFINKGYIYTNKSNHFDVYFNADPNKGFVYFDEGDSASTDSDDILIKINQVIVGDTELVAREPIIDGGKITYPDVLPFTDLQYIVDSKGVSKKVILKEENALTNDFSKVQFVFDSPLDFNPINNNGDIDNSITNINSNTVQRVDLVNEKFDDVIENNSKDGIVDDQEEIAIKKNDENRIKLGGAVTYQEVIDEGVDSEIATEELTKEDIKDEFWEISDDKRVYTIKPDQEFLNDDEREFPIVIDPEIANAGLSAYGFTSSRGSGKSLRNIFAVGSSSTYDSTTYGGYGVSDGYLKFNTSGFNGAIINDARLSLYGYQVNGSYTIQVNKVNRSIEDRNYSWPGYRNYIGQYGSYINVNWYQNNYGTKKFTTADDISHLIKNTNELNLGLRHSAGQNRGGFFCVTSSRLPCRNTPWPVLEVKFTRWSNSSPSTPFIRSPQGTEFISNCDGSCFEKKLINFTIDNVTDGESLNDIEDRPSIVTEYTNHNNSYLYYNKSTRKITIPRGYIGEGTVTVKENLTSGIWEKSVYATDLYGARSASSNKVFNLVDGAAPNAITRLIPNNQGNLNSIFATSTYDQLDQEITIGRDKFDIQNTTPQIDLNLPKFADNIGQRVMIKKSGSQNSYLSLNEGIKDYNFSNKVDFGAKNNLAGSQQWIIDGYKIKPAADQDFCIDGNRVINNERPHLWLCKRLYDTNKNQELEYDINTNQIKFRSFENMCLGYDSANDFSAGRVVFCNINGNVNPNSLFELERIHVVRIQSVKDSNYSLQFNGLNQYPRMSPNSFDKQYFYYFEEDKTLRDGSGNDCIAPIRTNYFVTQRMCSDVGSVGWEYRSDKTLRPTNNTNVCLDLWNQNVFNTQILFTGPCHSGNTQQFDLNEYARTITTNVGLQYQVEVTDLNSNQKSTSNWTSSNQLQLALVDGNLDFENKKFEIQDDGRYSIRVRAKDRKYYGNVSKWYDAGIVNIDYKLPEVKNFTIYRDLISSTGVSFVSFDVDLEDVQRASVKIYKEEDGSREFVTEVSECRDFRVLNDFPIFKRMLDCDLTKLNISTPGFFLDQNYLNLKDGKYVLIPNVVDKAGNTNIDDPDNIGFLRVDNTGAKIFVSYPENNSYTNKDNFEIKGSVGGLNYDGGVSGDQTNASYSLNGSEYIDIELNELGNFVVNLDLVEGENTINFRSQDIAGNTVDYVTDGDQKISNWIIINEKSAPSINNIKINDLLYDQSEEVNDDGFKVSFDVLDIDQFSSGIEVKNINLGLLREIPGQDETYLDLIKNGEIINKENIVNNFECSQGEQNTFINCSLDFDNLQLDGKYSVYLKAIDNAGNKTCNYENNFDQQKCVLIQGSSQIRLENLLPEIEIKTNFYSNSDLPSNTNFETEELSFPTKKINFQVEKGSSVILKNQSNDRQIEFTADSSSHRVYPVERILPESENGFSTAQKNIIRFANRLPNANFTDQEVYDNSWDIIGKEKLYTYYRTLIRNRYKLLVYCDRFIDHDNDSNTDDIEYCDVTIDTGLVKNKGEEAQNNEILLELKNGDLIKNYSKNYKVDTNNLSINVNKNLDVFSPNNDGVNDEINFSVDIQDNGEILSPHYYIAYIRNSENKIASLASGYWSRLEDDLIKWDGKVSRYTNIPGKKIGDQLDDGDYRIDLSLYVNGFSYRTPWIKTPFKLETKVDNQTTITTPINNKITTRGAINLKGIGPKSDENNLWETVICAKDNDNLDGGCLTEEIVKNDEEGNFSLIFDLPRFDTNYKLEAYSINQNNLRSEYDQKEVIVQYLTPESIENVEFTSSIDGVNNKEITECLANNDCGSLELEDVKKLDIEIEVKKGVESIQIDFADNTNLNELPGTDQNNPNIVSSFAPKQNIAILNDTVDIDNQNNKNFYGIDNGNKNITSGNDLTQNSTTFYNPCDNLSCRWTFSYPYPYFFGGGEYEIRIRSFKGGSVQETTKSFEVNGKVRTKLEALRIEKLDFTNNCYIENKNNPNTCDQYEYKKIKDILSTDGRVYYTNRQRNKIFLGGGLDARYSVDIDEVNNDGSLLNIVKNQSVENKHVNFKDLSGNDTENILDSNGFGTLEVNLLDKNGLKNETKYIISIYEEGQKSQTLQEIVLIYDTKNPELVSTEITNLTNSKALYNFANTGDQLNIRYNTSEPLSVGSVITENNFSSTGKRLIDQRFTLNDEEYNCSDLDRLDLLNGNDKTKINDNLINTPANCKFEFDNADTFDSSIVLSGTGEGIYNPTIKLVDYAGNSVLFGYDSNVVQSHQERVLNNLLESNDFDPIAFADIEIIAKNRSLLEEKYNYPFTTVDVDELKNNFQIYLDDTNPYSEMLALNGVASRSENGEVFNDGVNSNNQNKFDEIDLKTNNGDSDRSVELKNSLNNALNQLNSIQYDRLFNNSKNFGTDEVEFNNPSLITNNDYAVNDPDFKIDDKTIPKFVTKNDSIPLVFPVENHFRSEININLLDGTIIDGDFKDSDNNYILDTYKLKKAYNDLDQNVDGKFQYFCKNEDNQFNDLLDNVIKTISFRIGEDKTNLEIDGIQTRSVYDCLIIYNWDIQNDIAIIDSNVDSYEQEIKNQIDINLASTEYKLLSPAINNNIDKLNIDNNLIDDGAQNTSLSSQKNYQVSINPIDFAGNYASDQNDDAIDHCDYGDVKIPTNRYLSEDSSDGGFIARNNCQFFISRDNQSPLNYDEAIKFNKDLYDQGKLIDNTGFVPVYLTGFRDGDQIFDKDGNLIFDNANNKNNVASQIRGSDDSYIKSNIDKVNNYFGNKTDKLDDGSQLTRHLTTNSTVQAFVIMERAGDLVIEALDNIEGKAIDINPEGDYFYNLDEQRYEIINDKFLIRNNTNTDFSNINKDNLENEFTKDSTDVSTNITFTDKGVDEGECVDVTSGEINTPFDVNIPRIVNRRYGKCGDGLYQVKYQGFDQVGNYSGQNSAFIERDTVAPSKPQINVSASVADIDKGQSVAVANQYLQLELTGEGKSIAHVKIKNSSNSSVINKEFTLNNDDGKLIINDLIGKLNCETTYTIESYLVDEIGNISDTSTSSTSTKDCPVCSNFILVDKTASSRPIGTKYQNSSTQTITTSITTTLSKSEVANENMSGFAHPLGDSSNYNFRYGYSSAYFNNTRFHGGIDYSRPAGTNVFASKSGKIIKNSWNSEGYGNLVIIDHGDGTRTYYAHLLNYARSHGDYVNAGDLIGYIGSTGFSTGPHLHFEIRINGKTTDPAPYIYSGKTAGGISFLNFNSSSDYSNSDLSKLGTVLESNRDYAVVQTVQGNLNEAQSNYLDCPDQPYLPDLKTIVTTVTNNETDSAVDIFEDDGYYDDSDELISDQDFDSSIQFLNANFRNNKSKTVDTTESFIDESNGCFSDLLDSFKKPLEGMNWRNFAGKIYDATTGAAKKIFKLFMWGWENGFKALAYKLLEGCGITKDVLNDFINSPYLGGFTKSILKGIKSTIDSFVGFLDGIISGIKWVADQVKNLIEKVVGSLDFELLGTITELVVSIGGGLLCATITATGIGVVLVPICTFAAGVLGSVLKHTLVYVGCLAQTPNEVCEFNWKGVLFDALFDVALSIATFGLGKAVAPLVKKIKVGGVVKFLKFGDEAAEGAGKGAKYLDDAAEVAESTCKGSYCKLVKALCNCFVAGTLVTGLVLTGTNTAVNANEYTEDKINVSIANNIFEQKELPIENYKEGDYVLTSNVFNPGQSSTDYVNETIDNYNNPNNQFTGSIDTSNNLEYKPIERTIVQTKEDIASVTIDNSLITTTKDHEWIVVNKDDTQDNILNYETKRTHQLDQNDKVLTTNGEIKNISNIELSNSKTPTTTYNFTIQDNHNYFVEGVLVHNSCLIDLSKYKLPKGVNTRGMKNPAKHFAKHGNNDLVKAGKNAVTPQKYFDDANRFLNKYKGGSVPYEKVGKDQIPRDITITGDWVYKLKDPNSGYGGFISSNNELISFWYV